MKDWRITHNEQVSSLVSEGWSILATGVSLDDAHSKSKRKAWPVGSRFFWTSGTIVAPPVSVEEQEKAA